MTDLKNKNIARESFTDLIRKRPSLEHLAESQVMQGINTFQNLALEYALYSLENIKQESYLSTSQERSSILALAEDRQYLSRKPTPSKGQLRCTNKSDSVVGLPSHYQLVSEDQRYYMTTDAVSIQSGESTIVDLCQVRKQELLFTIEHEEPFIEFEFGRETSKLIHSFRVFVDLGEGYEEWETSVRFRNSRDSKVFDEFYSHTDQVGIRFGNNIFGLIPKKDSIVKVELWLTDGDTKLMPNQALAPIENVSDQVEFYTSSVIQGGTFRESTEELQKNAMYYPLYDENHVWDDDYEFFIKTHFPQVVWCRVWGEAEQEKMDGGELNLKNHNKIFFCCYSPSNPDIGKTIEPFLKENIPQLNRRYENVAIEKQVFTVRISGKIKRSIVLSDAQSLIRDGLWNNYHIDSPKRRRKCLSRDLYRMCNSLNIFEEQEDIVVTIDGVAEAQNLKQVVMIDFDNTVLDLDYL